MPFFPVFAREAAAGVCFATDLGTRPTLRKCLELQHLARAAAANAGSLAGRWRGGLTNYKEGNNSRIALMMITAQYGYRSMPAIGGMRRRNGRSTGSHTLTNTDCSGE